MTAVPPPAGPPPGWYADPPGGPRARWWDGTAWTEHYQTLTGTMSVVETTTPAEPPTETRAMPIQDPPMTRAQLKAAAAAGSTTDAAPLTRRAARASAGPEEPVVATGGVPIWAPVEVTAESVAAVAVEPAPAVAVEPVAASAVEPVPAAAAEPLLAVSVSVAADVDDSTPIAAEIAAMQARLSVRPQNPVSDLGPGVSPESLAVAAADASPAVPAVSAGETQGPTGLAFVSQETSADAFEPIEPHLEQSPVSPEGERALGTQAEPEAGKPVEPHPEAFPDQIIGVGRLAARDRPPAALTYRPSVPPPMSSDPLPGAYVTAKSKSLMPVSTQNGPAKASLVVILIGMLISAAIYWWVTASNPALAQTLILVVIGLFGFAFVLAVAGLVISVTRPTTKVWSIIALVLSSVLTFGVVVLYGLRLVAAAPLDVPEVESTIQAWYLSDSGAKVSVVCPIDPPTSDGSQFVCSASHASGQVDAVQVTVVGRSFTWKVTSP